MANSSVDGWIMSARTKSNKWSQLTRIPIAQIGNRNTLLLLPNALVFLLVVGCLETLPRERTTHEVHENMSQALEVITPRLFWMAIRRLPCAENNETHLGLDGC